MTEKEQNELHKILVSNNKFFIRQRKKYDRGRKLEVKRIYRLLMKKNRHVKGYVAYPKDIYYYMKYHSQYAVSSSKEVERIIKEVLL